MTAKQWAKVKEVVAAALDLPEAERRSFVEMACGKDSVAFSEALSLLNVEITNPSQLDELPTAGAQPMTVAGSDGFTPGTILAGRYRIVALLGRGGMGEVYRADDLKLRQTVALKFLPRILALDPTLRERFFKEVRITRQLSHPNICRVYDIAESDGHHFLSMEYIDGENLASLIKRIGYLPNEKALDITRQLLSALAASHERGVLHRDLKPANIMLDGRGRVRIMDFGIAVGTGEETLVGGICGTPAYMAPEQFAGRPASERSDIYSLGLVLYEIYCGKRAFDATISDLREEPGGKPKPPSELRQGMDPVVERLIMGCLQKDPQLRPASAAHLASTLPGLQGGDPLASAIASGLTPPPEIVAASGQKEGIHPVSRIRIGRWAVATLGLLAAIVVGIAVRSNHSFSPPIAKVDRFDLSVQASVAGAHILVNKEDRGTSPQRLSLQEGQYTIDAAMPGYEQVQPVFLKLTAGTPAPESIDIRLQPRAAVLRLFADAQQVLIDSAVVRLQNGGYESNTLSPGVHRVTFGNTESGNVDVDFRLTPGEMPLVRSVSGSAIGVVVSTLDKKGEIYADKPLTTSLDGGNPQKVDNGGLHFSIAEPGRHLLTVTAEQQKWRDVFQADDTPEIDIFIGPNPSAGSLVVTSNLSQASIEIHPIDQNVKARETQIRNGVAVVPRLIAGTYRVTMIANGYNPIEKTVVIDAGNEGRIDFHVEGTGSEQKSAATITAAATQFRRADLNASPSTATAQGFKPSSPDVDVKAGRGTEPSSILGGIPSTPQASVAGISTPTVSTLPLPAAQTSTRGSGERPEQVWLERVWSLDGTYAGVAWDAPTRVLHASNGKSLVDLDESGKITRQVSFPHVSNLRIAHFADEHTVLLAWDYSGLTAYDLSGKELWKYSLVIDPLRPSVVAGVNDVWPMDLDGHGSDNVIVGFNGSVGLHVLDSKGHELWKNTSIGNVGHVSAGDVFGEGKPQIVTTSAVGLVHVFNRDLTGRKDISQGFRVNTVRTGKISQNDKHDTIFAIGESGSASLPTKTWLAAVSGDMDRAKRWIIQLPGSQAVYSAYLAPGKHWLAVGRRSGEVDVVDIERGALAGSIDVPGVTPEVSWMSSKDSEVPLLVVSTGTQLIAFRVNSAK